MPFRLKRRTEVPVLHGQGFRRQRAAGTVRLRGAGAQEGALPPLVNHPRRGCTRLPATANKFYPHSVEKFDLR